ncbi:helix-turn-helix domain-containing protein [Catalinimonas niigatensis]|uniref:helix-turn-helix domain-containing protein n=1 Tax=Catalinimonas niigatensis TaxID=1397264 RepID=UPI002665C571|nr:response regulator transcription factor [Catalinimonas niigatensis]WPP48703.1 helix-turn-helix transcriptional regulator [Catalinimonas niigatensis]
MKKEERRPHKFDSISDAHHAFNLPEPQHPLISLINGANRDDMNIPTGSHVLNFYKISYKPRQSARLRYGQNYYDFNEGGLLFASPNQIIGGDDNKDAVDCSMYTLLIHPDFFLGHPIAQEIRQYGFFSYATHEALHLSAEEKETMLSIFKMIETELSSRIDDFSQYVIISQIALLLNFANRFYNRQFITRKAVNHDILQKLESYLDDYLDHEKSLNNGIPTVQFLAEQVNLSPSYLSDMLRSLTGRNAQQLIHDKLIEKAKELLSTSNFSVSEIAYQLGFEYSQSFNRLFKTKTDLSPLEFRRSFN